MKKQVDKSHYGFARYVSKGRMMSMWHQLDEVFALQPTSVLEIGPGPGIFKALAGLFGIPVETLDVDPELKPDHLASADEMPFPDNAYDLVCAFQTLEHVPYKIALRVFSEMARIAENHVVISLPDARPLWPYSLYIPKIGEYKFFVPRPWTGPKECRFDGQHYWEVNRKELQLNRVINDLAQAGRMRFIRSFRVHENPYHRFFVFTHTSG